ncbi:hypothetical protein MTO96_029600 [Rhipicephalus appendiculatus]
MARRAEAEVSPETIDQERYSVSHVLVNGLAECEKEDRHERVGGTVDHPYDFVQLFNSSENIWTYRSSWNANFTCERYIMKNISGKTIVLETKFTFNNKTHKYTAEGRLRNVRGQSRPLNVMSMRDYWGDSLNKEIVYASSDYKCAVLYVERYKGWPSVTFDLLVKKSQRREGPSADCISNYNENISARVIKGTNRTVYSPECRRREKKHPKSSNLKTEKKPASATYPDIREFMLNPPRTWTYNATLNIPYTCKVDVAINITGRDIYFNQSGIDKRGIFSGIRIGHTYQSYDLRGRPWNLMFITDYLTGYTRRQVRFLIPRVCAVNKVERYDDTFPPNYELLVKDYWLEGPPKVCLKR